MIETHKNMGTLLYPGKFSRQERKQTTTPSSWGLNKGYLIIMTGTEHKMKMILSMSK